MKISIHSYYSYALCGLEIDSKELTKEVQAYLDSDFGQTKGLSLKKGDWERVVITEKDIINCLSGEDDCDVDIYYYYVNNDEQCWFETTLFTEISDCIHEYCSDKEEVIEWGDLVSRRVFVQDNLVHEDF